MVSGVSFWCPVSSVLSVFPLSSRGLSDYSPAASILLLVGAAVVGLGQGACRPAYQAMIPEIVTVDHLQAANAAMSISVRVTSLVGPAAVSFITLAFRTGAAFTTMAALWLVSAVVPPRGRVSSRASSSRRNILSEFLVAVEEAKRHPWSVAGLATLTIVIATGYSVTAVLVPAISHHALPLGTAASVKASF
jgi:Major Facilitator Superfamily